MSDGVGEPRRSALACRNTVLPDTQVAREQLANTLDQVKAAVHMGSFDSNFDEGVLLDINISGIRCVMIALQPSMTITLSPREQQIARMVASGLTNQAIASTLAISVWTVSTHIRRIFAKLSVTSRAEMVAHLLAFDGYRGDWRK